jgi:ubiquinone/menaquinone biosynthesis C-methylase UbiE
MLSKIQGMLAEKLFHGISNNKTIKLVYGESANLFSDVIKKEYKNNKKYNLLDLGSHKGEFLQDLLTKLPEYDFNTTAVEFNNFDLEQNIADNKILSDVKKIPTEDKKFDITISRYVLAWNSLDNQRKIISEMKRLTKGIVILQHQGADNDNPEELQNSSRELFSGVVPTLKRDEFYFSTEKELENILKEDNIKYKIIQDRKIEGLAELLIEKYSLSEEDSIKVKNILEDSNYIVQSTFILDFRKLE